MSVNETKSETHAFVRPGQVAADLPAPDACVRCGRPAAEHAAAPNGVTATRVALTLHRAMSAWQGGDIVGDAPHVRGDNRMPGEFQVRMPATGQLFRVTVTEIRS